MADIKSISADREKNDNYKILGLLYDSVKVKMNLPNDDGALLFTHWEYMHCNQHWWKTKVDEIRQANDLPKLKDGHDKDVYKRLMEDYIPSEDTEDEGEIRW
jgi:hypothetical protein